jgi:hypothetical protein
LFNSGVIDELDDEMKGALHDSLEGKINQIPETMISEDARAEILDKLHNNQTQEALNQIINGGVI